jgi:galactokinase/mevalonate kinase-like predicted kinase
MQPKLKDRRKDDWSVEAIEKRAREGQSKVDITNELHFLKDAVQSLMDTVMSKDLGSKEADGFIKVIDKRWNAAKKLLKETK